ncbi:unnamed protein product [Dracunculus medinensis]|uniref:Uncharacterized protein n=1 Tax=Dracunculus medinensis TaxID=318479 RepID=A0A0N4U1A2_DRAME|nr:unnamed protein product [Dracunculus medinensis]
MKYLLVDEIDMAAIIEDTKYCGQIRRKNIERIFHVPKIHVPAELAQLLHQRRKKILMTNNLIILDRNAKNMQISISVPSEDSTPKAINVKKRKKNKKMNFTNEFYQKLTIKEENETKMEFNEKAKAITDQ